MKNIIELDDNEQRALRKLNDAQQGMQNFMQSMMTAGETRATALQEQGRLLFTDLAAKYGLDMANQTWVPSADGKSLKLVALRVADNA